MHLAEREQLRAAERAALVAEEAMFSKQPRTHSNYQRMHTMFTAFLGGLFATSAVGWQTCRPDDVCVFLRHHLLPTLAGRSGPECAVASSTLHGLVSSLSQCFVMRGRTQDWCDQRRDGNPVRSGLVSTALRVYQRRQLLSGSRPRSAVPIQLTDLRFLVHRMDAALAAAALAHASARAGLLLRDITHMLYMWNSGRRGQDVLHVNWEDLYLVGPDGQATPVATLWVGEIQCSTVPFGDLLMVPVRTKTEYLRRPATQEIVVHAEAPLCAIRRLRTLYQWHRCRFQTAPRGPVFLNQRSPFYRLTSQAAANRVRANIVEFGRDHGETMHSFRRGHVQAAQAAAEPAAVTMQRVGMSCMSTFAKYSDRGRHLR